jgi:hypothetical protein
MVCGGNVYLVVTGNMNFEQVVMAELRANTLINESYDLAKLNLS